MLSVGAAVCSDCCKEIQVGNGFQDRKKRQGKHFTNHSGGSGRGEGEREGRTCGQFGKESLTRNQPGLRSICSVLSPQSLPI